MAGKTAKQILDQVPGAASKLSQKAGELTIEDLVSLESAFAGFDAHRLGPSAHALDSCCCCCTAVASTA